MQKEEGPARGQLRENSRLSVGKDKSATATARAACYIENRWCDACSTFHQVKHKLSAQAFKSLLMTGQAALLIMS